jgi:hypothetical protein
MSDGRTAFFSNSMVGKPIEVRDCDKEANDDRTIRAIWFHACGILGLDNLAKARDRVRSLPGEKKYLYSGRR